MIFSSLSAVSPAWYYNLPPKIRKHNFWVDARLLDAADRDLIDEPTCYTSRNASLRDMAYQAWLKGVIGIEGIGLNRDGVDSTPVDEYCFLRRHFNPIWAYFLLFTRIIEFNNPFSELAAFISSRNVKRIDPWIRTKDWRSQIHGSSSLLLGKNPRVSVIIPTLNRYSYLTDALRDLEDQDYKNFEVIIVDQSDDFNEAFYSSFDLNIRVLHQQEKALWLARNTAIEKSEGELILLFDDDSRVKKDWISSHIRCIDFFDADISSGTSISAIGAKTGPTYSYYKWGDQIDTGNVMLRKDVFRAIGLFDRQFEGQRQGDGEFGLRAYLAGFKNISNPDAARLHLKVEVGGLREMGSWDSWRPRNFFAPRPLPSVLYYIRKYFGRRAALYQILQSVFPSVVPYRYKGSNSMLVVGSLAGLLLLPLITVSVMRSWRLSTKKLHEGARIPRLA